MQNYTWLLQLEKNYKTQFPHVQHQCNTITWHKEILLENQGKTRYPRQAYYPNDSKDAFTTTAEIVEEVEEEDGSGFTSKIKGYYDLVTTSLFQLFI
jgi:hypothetical protein